MKKLLTIIVPIYNTQDFLTKCLDSLIVNDNLLPLLEVLLIIDGSPDNSIIIAKKYQDKYPSTFIIIDKEGKIVNADAPRPSSGEITGLLEGLLKK